MNRDRNNELGLELLTICCLKEVQNALPMPWPKWTELITGMLLPSRDFHLTGGVSMLRYDQVTTTEVPGNLSIWTTMGMLAPCDWI